MTVRIRVLRIDKSRKCLYRFLDELIITLMSLIVLTDLYPGDDVNDENYQPDRKSDKRYQKQRIIS